MDTQADKDHMQSSSMSGCHSAQQPAKSALWATRASDLSGCMASCDNMQRPFSMRHSDGAEVEQHRSANIAELAADVDQQTALL